MMPWSHFSKAKKRELAGYRGQSVFFAFCLYISSEHPNPRPSQTPYMHGLTRQLVCAVGSDYLGAGRRLQLDHPCDHRTGKYSKKQQKVRWSSVDKKSHHNAHHSSKIDETGILIKKENERGKIPKHAQRNKDRAQGRRAPKRVEESQSRGHLQSKTLSIQK